MDWVLNALVGLGFLVACSVLLYLVLRWRQRLEERLREADARYAAAEAERKRQKERWGESP